MSALGSALRLLPRLDRRTCDVDDLVDAARVLVATGRPGLRLFLDEADPHHPCLEVEEDERSRRTDLMDLAEQVVGTQPDLGPAGLAAALDRWLDERPVTDAEAARRGIAVLGWSRTSGDDLAWQVAVQRRTGLVSWAPHPFSAAVDVLGIREAARTRAADVVVRCTVEGPVLLLDADQPHLATAALSAPEQILARMAALGLRLSEGSVVITPGRPVAWAGRSVAERLAGETVEPCAVLSWREVVDLPWS